MSGTRDAQHVDSVRPQSFVSTIGHTRTDMVFVFVGRNRLHFPDFDSCVSEIITHVHC
jgi:hypothetical protein